MMLASYITAEAIKLGIISSEEEDTYICTLISMTFSAITWGTLLLMGILMNCLQGCIVFLLLYLPLRIYAGGFHCNKRRNCYFSSVVIFAVMITAYKFSGQFPMAYQDYTFIIASFGIFFMAPVPDKNKSMTEAESRHHQGVAKKILIIEFVIVVLVQFLFREHISSELVYFTTVPAKLLFIQLIIGAIKNAIYQKNLKRM